MDDRTESDAYHFLMNSHQKSSRQRFHEYRQSIAGAKSQTNDDTPDPSKDPAEIVVPKHRQKESKQRLRSFRQLIASFWKLLGPHKKPVIFSLATLTVSTALGLVPPAATKFIVDSVLGDTPIPPVVVETFPFVQNRWTFLIAITGGIVCISLLKVLLHIWGRWQATRATKRLQMSIRKQLFEHTIRLPLNTVHTMKSGGVASLLRQDAGSIGDLIFGLLYNPWRAIVQLIGSLIILLVVDWRLLLGALAVLPAVYLSHRTWITEIRPRFRDVRERRQGIDSKTTETFAGIRIVRGFSRQRTETVRIMTDHHLMGRQELYVWWWMRTIEVIWAILIPLASSALILYGGWQVIHGTLTIGDLMMFMVYLLMLLEPLAILAESAASLQDNLSALDRVLDVLATDKEMPSDEQSTVLTDSEVRGEVTLENVAFRYQSDTAWALQDINLTVQPGEVIALVGPSGAGKTTLCNLVARFYDPTSGRILLDGQDLRSIDVESYRGILGIVEQDVFLFDGTVAENIAYAKQNASDDEISAAARAANAEEFITSFPYGYETIIGERGVKLSGGQRQRLAIARAILADPKILILDEATSNLDTESERLIQNSLHELLEHRTAFVIAHRLSTIQNADKILVLDHGRIIESGTHLELMRQQGRYHDMVQMQLSPEERPRLKELLNG
ncbi:putative multidrug export ATP-binding/permease protein [Thalassoglobus neptunius]|uniref:Putative multidrug export ATP-binding/permease protein n=1 Tax=Thalassoglobus neptunius TaxID=1938619 RepID=A0A5C5X5S8_9PLAN|nr:ABC transporter ATP-binding protein [Thalassoglobus neptunius]TWT58118.1 putative multidrug export ATP-binding/permease protein [Thalassoglobus neptunius]